MNVLQDVQELQETRKEHELRLAKLEKLMEASILDTQQLKLEMRLFRDEMLAFKDEMRAFKDEMKVFKDECQHSKEMRTFKNEMNRRWGELANKMGTLVEDIVYPGLPLALKRRFDLEVDVVTHNMSAKDTGPAASRSST